MNQNEKILEELKKEGLFLPNGNFNPSYVKKFLNHLTPERKIWYENQLGSTLSEKIYNIIHNNTELPTCPICGAPVKFISFNEGYRGFCSNPCRAKGMNDQAKKTNLERYGVEHPAQNKEIYEKMKRTTKERYGVENIFEDNKFIKNKVREKLGVDNPMYLDSVKEKMKLTNRKKYGEKYELVIEKRNKTNLEKYGNICSIQGKEVWKKVSKIKKEKFWNQLTIDSRFKEVEFKFTIDEYHGTLDVTKPIYYPFECKKCHYQFNDYIAWERDIQCPKCNPKQSQGVLEKELFDWISSIVPNVIQNTRRIISPLEIDIYLPDYNLAIEFDEIYWHSENSSGRGSSYHLNKTKECAKQGINLIHIYDSEWKEKKEIIQSIILSKLGIYKEKIGARKCQIKNVDSMNSQVFLNENHIQGYAGGMIKKGLYYKEELVALLIVSPNRFKKGTYEIVRFVTKKGVSVQGALSKLWKEVKTELPFNTTIISYVDKRFFSGKSNEVIGLQYEYDNDPQYYYTKDYNHLLNRMNFQKKYLKEKLTEYSPELTEWQNMQLNGYDRIWDCGTKVYSGVVTK